MAHRYSSSMEVIKGKLLLSCCGVLRKCTVDASEIPPHVVCPCHFPVIFSSRFPLQPASALCSRSSFPLSYLFLFLSRSLPGFVSFLLSQSVFYLNYSYSLFQLLQTDGRSRGHGEVSGWGDGLQGGGLYQNLCLGDVLRSLCQTYTHTHTVLSPWPSCCVSAVRTASMCVYMCV